MRGLLLNSVLPLALLAVATPGLALADEAKGDFILDARLRYEFVDQDGFANQADALTLRTRLGYETPAMSGFKLLVEAENVTALVERYNSTTNGEVTYPTVLDPEATEINRAQISWTGSRAEAVVGRQRLILNNARFVGNVGFRQNEQTFDAAKLVFKPLSTVSFTLAYIDSVHRILGDDSPQGEWDSDSYLMQFDAKAGSSQISAYGYLLDFANAPTQSSATWGARLTGSHPLSNGVAATWEVEYARQSEYGSNPATFDLDYLALAGGLKKDTKSIAIGLERLDGNGSRGFGTPLATLHVFQGWADLFLATPANGVRDFNLRASTTVKPAILPKPLKIQVAFHDFADADGSQDYGQEFDLSFSTPITPHVNAELKAAVFDGDLPAFADRAKVWLTLEMKF